MNTNTTYTLKTNPAKYANLHKCDQKYWRFSCDFSQAQSADVLKGALKDTADLLTRILESKAFKPENEAAATDLALVLAEQSKALLGKNADMAVSTFVVYQLQRYAFRIWYRDTKAARDAATPAKQEKPKATKATKAPAKQEKKPTAKAPAKQDVAKANEATFVSKLTKAQKKELLLTLMAELLK
jgi:hypothetical protein